MYGNYFYKNKQDQYSPAEIAMAKFTFRDGITKRYHTFINPSELRKYDIFNTSNSKSHFMCIAN